MEGLPLALELCAAQIELFSPTQLLAQLQDRRLDLLIDGAHDLSPQHRILRAAIGRSYALLNDQEPVGVRLRRDKDGRPPLDVREGPLHGVRRRRLRRADHLRCGPRDSAFDAKGRFIRGADDFPTFSRANDEEQHRSN